MQETMATEAVVLDPPRLRVSALEATALKAALWTFLSYGSSQGLRVVNSLVLTHILLPAAFGEMQLVTVFVVGITLLSDIGLGPSVIQSKRGDDPNFLNTAWTLQAGRGIVLWVIAVGLAYPVARLYHDPHLIKLLPVVALGTIISGFNSTGLLSLSRNMGVRRLFAIDFSKQVLAFVITVAFALWLHSVWALIIGSLASNLYQLAISHHYKVVPGVRNRFRMHRESLTEIVSFGKWIILGTAFYFFAAESDKLVMGRLVTLTALGVYGIAYQISDVPRSIIVAFSQRVGFPLISKLTHLPLDQFRAQFLRYRLYALSLGAFLLAAMAVWGSFIVTKLYKPAYHDAAWMVPVLALGLWHTLLYTTTNPVLFALGKSKYNAIGNAAYCIAMLVGIPVGFHFFGLFGAVVAVAAGDFPLYLVIQFGATREGVKPLWQDLQLTAALLGFLLLDFTLRKAF